MTVVSMNKLRRYSWYRPSGIEWLGEIPEHWRQLAVKRLTIVKRGASPRPIDDPKYFDDDGEYSWVRIADVTASVRYLENTTQRLSLLGKSLSVPLKPGDLFLSIAGTVGKPIITKIKCCIHDGFVYFPQYKENKEFLYYIFASGQPYHGLGKWGTQLNLNTDTVGWIQIGLPPSEEQRAIAAFLDQETARIDALIAKKERQIELLQEKRTALISRAVTKGLDPDVKMKPSGIEWLGEIPEHWEAIPVKRQFDIQLGKMLQNNPESTADISASYIKALHVQWGKVDTSDLPEMWASPEDIKQFGVRSGDLLVCEGGEAGRAGIVDTASNPCIIQNALHRVRGKGGDVRYLQYVLHAVGSRGWFDVLCNKATIAHFTREKLAELRMPLPPSLDEQCAIAAFLDRETARIDALIKKVEESIAKLREYRIALISAAVTGKIDVRKEVA